VVQVEVAQLDYHGATAALDDMKAELEEFREGIALRLI
jgi:hypothetical protein